MKKIKAAVFAFLVLIMAFTVTASAAEKQIRVWLDGKELQFNVNPILIKGTTFVEFRGLFTALGYKLQYEPSTKTIQAVSGESAITLQVGTNIAIIDSKKFDMKAAPFIQKGRTMVPLRFISEASEMFVKWDKANLEIEIMSKAYAEALASVREFFKAQTEYELNGEIDKMIASVDPESPIYENVKRVLPVQLGEAKVNTTYKIVRLVEFDSSSAVAYVQQRSEKISGGEFRDFEAEGYIKLTLWTDGEWKIYSVETLEFKYIDNDAA